MSALVVHEAEGGSENAWRYVRTDGSAASYYFNSAQETSSFHLPVDIAEQQVHRFEMGGGQAMEEAANARLSGDDDFESGGGAGMGRMGASPAGRFNAAGNADGGGPILQGLSTPRQESGATDSGGANATGTLTANNNSNNNNGTAASWVVRLHADSGQFFYADEFGQHASTWHNPFLTSGGGATLADSLDTLDIGQMEAQEEEQLQDLAGFDLVQSAEVFESDHAHWAAERLDAWMERKDIRLGDDDVVSLRFPEYVNLDRQLLDVGKFRIQVDLAAVASDNVLSMSMQALPRKTVQDLLDMVFTKFRNTEGRPLDMEGTTRYIFKVSGFSDYLLHGSLQLQYYDYLDWAHRKGRRIELVLVRLTDAEMMDLGPILTSTEEDMRAKDVVKYAPGGDEWEEDNTRAMKQLHTDLVPSLCGLAHEDISFIEKTDVHWPFRAVIRGIENCPMDIQCDLVLVEMDLYFSGRSLSSYDFGRMGKAGMAAASGGGGGLFGESGGGNPSMTAPVPMTREPRFSNSWLSTSYTVDCLPAGTRLGFLVVGLNAQGSGRTPIAGASVAVTDCHGRLVAGSQSVRLWPSKDLQSARSGGKSHRETFKQLNIASGVLGENIDDSCGVLHVVFDSYSAPVIQRMQTLEAVERMHEAGLLPCPAAANGGTTTRLSGVFGSSGTASAEPSREEQARIEAIKTLDPLTELAPQDQVLLWQFREWCAGSPELLPRFLQSVQWLNPADVQEVHRLVATSWAPLPEQLRVKALELLDVAYGDPIVREFAVRQVDAMSDEKLSDLLLQLVQVLKYETYHDSPLARMLLRRAIRSPLRVGHYFFWMLRSEMHDPGVSERFGTLLLRYLKFAGPHRSHLRRQNFVNSKIKVIADTVKSVGKPQKLAYVREELTRLNPQLPGRFQLPLSPRIECTSLIVEKCKVMGSKKEPLWLCFNNVDPTGEPYLAIFKAGDDLRQDQMTLQLLRVMDEVWRNESDLDLRILPYLCCSTGDELGMLEVVKHSDTTAHIQQAYGGKMMGALKSTPIDAFLRTHNKDSAYAAAVENFVHTCAGYCVATYVMGIGDRHSDNIMVTESGHLFHIDFGHFLGNFKSKFGIKRERAPFVFTPEMAYVMTSQGSSYGGLVSRSTQPEYDDFVRMCCQAYNVLREQAHLFITLFTLMVPAGMPELLEKEDITYLRDKLSLEMTLDQADRKFRDEIKASLGTVSRRVDNFFHNIKHG